MNKRIIFLLPVLAFLVLLSFYSCMKQDDPVNSLRLQHEEFLKKNAPEKSGFSEEEKESEGRAAPPNPYYEQMRYLTMNPALGYPEPYKLKELHEKLRQQRKIKSRNLRAPGDSPENTWVSRGPDTVGGRTRVVFFDPNDNENKRVFAGAVSGGLWVNNDITNLNSTWSLVPGVPSNINFSSLTVDPRDQDTWYAGTGEQYTGGDVLGTGVYKTSDGGKTWNRILEVKDFATGGSGQNALVVGGLYYINDIIAWDNGTSTELFIAVSTHIYANANNPDDYLGYYDTGLYASKDDGANWEKVLAYESFNDFEIDAEGNLWAATTYSPGAGDNGGKIYKRPKGVDTDFSLINEIPNVWRTEIEASATNPNKFYILTETVVNRSSTVTEADLWITTDAFVSFQHINEPNDADEDILANDFSRGLAFYALVIEADPTNDNIVYVGSIDLFRSTDSGQTWEQISKWSENSRLNTLPVSLVHADHHAINFRPGNTNQAVFGHDGGVSFARDLAAASTSDVFITPKRKYVTTQFYSIAVAPDSFSSGDYFLGGTQDNGTQLIQNGNPNSIGILGGDGAHTFYDQVNTDYFIANLIYNNLIVAYDYSENKYVLIANNEDNDGFFINPQGLDSNLDKLYSNGPKGVLYRYDNLSELSPIVGDITDDDPVATRKSLKSDLLDASMSAIKVSPYTTSSSTLLLGLVNGKLVKVENADKTSSEAVFTEITAPSFVGSISDIEFGKTEDEIYVSFYNFGVISIWYTQNGNANSPTWVSKEGNLPDLPVLTILPNPNDKDEVIIGTDLGVWATKNFTNNIPTWEHSYNGMSDVKVTDLDLKKGTNQVFAASYGRGIFSGFFEEKGGPQLPPGENPEDLVVYPNISNGSYNLFSRVDISNAEILVFDLQGQLIYQQEHALEENNDFPIELAKEASGMYFLKVKTGEKDFLWKIIKK
ncbi:MAG: T9SS type A sorting domain-containing protein [Salinimicrobium sp.]